MRQARLTHRCIAEAIGTFILVFFGTGVVHAAVLTGAQVGLWQIAVVWAIAIALAIYLVGGISGAHINPAITIALAAWKRFEWRLVPAYIASQLIGAIVAAAVLFALFQGPLAARESAKHVVRGQDGSQVTAMCYGEYFPSPGALAGGSEPWSAEAQGKLDDLIGPAGAFAAEAIGTMLLAFAVFALTDRRNPAAPGAHLGPLFIGLTVAILISVIAPLTQACFNPARDFGPRLFAYFAGWGRIAIPGPRGMGFLTVYILAPIVGAVLGGGLYARTLGPAMPPTEGVPVGEAVAD